MSHFGNGGILLCFFRIGIGMVGCRFKFSCEQKLTLRECNPPAEVWMVLTLWRVASLVLLYVLNVAHLSEFIRPHGKHFTDWWKVPVMYFLCQTHVLQTCLRLVHFRDIACSVTDFSLTVHFLFLYLDKGSKGIIQFLINETIVCNHTMLLVGTHGAVNGSTA